MKNIVYLLPFLFTTNLYASSITPCSGSWDGIGKSTCELLGYEGEVLESWNRFVPYRIGNVLFEITAYDANNSFGMTESGIFFYNSGHWAHDSASNPHQYALWNTSTKGKYILGIEDLSSVPSGIQSSTSDYDYNDYVVELYRSVEDEVQIDPRNVDPVPEPTILSLLGLSLLSLVRRSKKK